MGEIRITIGDNLDKVIDKIVKEKGFSSRAQYTLFCIQTDLKERGFKEW